MRVGCGVDCCVAPSVFCVVCSVSCSAVMGASCSVVSVCVSVGGSMI